MPVRRLPRQAAAVFRDGGLLHALRSELKDELTSSQMHQKVVIPSKFTFHYDPPISRNIIFTLPRNEFNEVIGVSALLAPSRLIKEESVLQKFFMKVCVFKIKEPPVLTFHCFVLHKAESSDFNIMDAWYYPETKRPERKKKYLGPKFSTLDRNVLQGAFKDYLISRGINTELMDFLLDYLNNKEQGQYMNWLRSLEAFAMDS